MKYNILFVLALFASNCFSQINSFYVKPIQTDNNYAAVQDSHLVVRNTVVNENKLFLFIGGTGSTTSNYLRISEFAGNQGYDVINLSYINDVAAASLKNSSDSLEFDKYRQEICYGTQSSPRVNVDGLNSIQTRVINLLKYLDSTFPSQSWNQYLVGPSTLNWSRITVAGHSQGGGHASFFAKFHKVDRVLMFSSPNDFSDFFSKPAHWLRIPGETPISKHFAYLSLLDEAVDFSKQLSNLEELGLYPLYDSTHVDNANPPYNNSRCLYTTQKPGLAVLYHNSTMKWSTINNAVWDYMLNENVSTSVKDEDLNIGAWIYPNPTSSSVTIQFRTNMLHEKFLLRKLNGQTILTGRITKSFYQQIDLTSFENGIYLLSVGTHTVKLIKAE